MMMKLVMVMKFIMREFVEKNSFLITEKDLHHCVCADSCCNTGTRYQSVRCIAMIPDNKAEGTNSVLTMIMPLKILSCTRKNYRSKKFIVFFCYVRMLLFHLYPVPWKILSYIRKNYRSNKFIGFQNIFLL